MTDHYQAVYDAIRSRFRVDVADIIERVARDAFDASFCLDRITHEFCGAALQMQRPSVVFKPKISKDGDGWCALLGDDIQVGVAAFGKSPAEAMEAFDVEFYKNEATIKGDGDAEE